MTSALILLAAVALLGSGFFLFLPEFRKYDRITGLPPEAQHKANIAMSLFFAGAALMVLYDVIS